MNRIYRAASVIAVCGLLMSVRVASGQDWPQWRGPNRDAKAAGFKAPAAWPAALNKKWDIPVGDGVANPSLVGDRLYVFSRDGADEALRSMNAATGEEVWKKSYPADPATGPAGGFPGPRCTPTVANGKVVTIGVQGLLTCWDAATGNKLWEKNEYVGASPQFFTSSSPIVVDGLCIAQLGGGRGGAGAMVAYELATGNEKWKAAEGSGSYGSPTLMSVDGMKVVIAPSETNMVAINTASGKVVWKIAYKQGRYNAATPIADGQTLIIAGPGSGMTALKLSKQGEELKEEEVWKYTENSLIYNTPVLKDGDLFGLSTGDQLFCIDIEGTNAKTAWTAPIAKAAAAFMAPGGMQSVFAQQQPEQRGGDRGGAGMGGGQRRGGNRRGGGMGGGGGYGSVVDAGSVLLALSPAADLVVFKPSKASYEEVARYKVSTEGATYAYPIPSGNRIYIKDKDSIAMWTLE